jgi:hypothetical protein
MATKLSKIKGEDWKSYRRVARYYERELKRIRDATVCRADLLRHFAARALHAKRK